MKLSIRLCILGAIVLSADARFFGINIFRPWDINLRPEPLCDYPAQLTAYMGRGLSATGYNPDGKKVNELQLYTPTQDALAMLRGFPEDSPMTRFLEDVLQDPSDNGIRGNFRVTGDFKVRLDSGIAFRYHFPYDITFGVHMPLYAMQLKNIQFIDLTPSTSPEDIRIQQNLMNNFKAVVNRFDSSLSLNDWEQVGVGDLALTAWFHRCFPQRKEYLRNVGLNLRLGVSMPTGFKEDINKIMSVPFGFDGSWVVFGEAGIWLNWWDYVRAGVDFEFFNLIGNTRERRFKTDTMQTDFLLLAKTRAYLDPGFVQRYNLFGELYHIYRGLSLSAAYEYWRHSDDHLTLATDEFSNAIANTAEGLQEWIIHQFIFRLWYDFSCDLYDAGAVPQLELYYKMPINGQRAVLIHEVGVGLTLNF